MPDLFAKDANDDDMFVEQIIFKGVENDHQDNRCLAAECGNSCCCVPNDFRIEAKEINLFNEEENCFHQCCCTYQRGLTIDLQGPNDPPEMGGKEGNA